MRLAKGAVAGLLVAAMVALLSPGGASATHLTETGSPGGPTVPWGFNEEWGWGWGWSSQLTNQQLELAGAIEPAGLAANRWLVQWAKVESRKGKYDWRETDGQYQAMQAHAAEPVMLLWTAPAWALDRAASCNDPAGCVFPPLAKYDADWKRFVRAAIARYPNVRAIEVWNEPNLGRFWSPAPDPRRYGAILKGVYEAARAERSSKPVLVGGLAPAGNTATTVGAAEFLKQLYASACACYFQGIATHPYTTQVPLVDNVAKRLDKIRAVRDAAADSAKRLWITEFGLSSNGTSDVTLENQGSELAQVYRSIEGHDVAAFVIHRFHDVGFDGPYWNETGIVREDLSLKPAYCQLGELIGTAC